MITFDCTDNSMWEALAPPTHAPLPAADAVRDCCPAHRWPR
ncbi:hypothetical protein AB0I54_40835 [Streptomyces sp. NPDC050625]